jgi:hypothetical protein
MSNELKKQSGAGRPSKLTDSLLKQLTDLWALTDENCLSDAEIARSLGIEPKQLENWIAYGTKGISGIRTRARSGIKLGYLARLNTIAKLAVHQGDLDTAANVYMFLLEKQFPREFGRFLKVQETKSTDWLETAIEDEITAFIAENQALINDAGKGRLDVPAADKV